MIYEHCRKLPGKQARGSASQYKFRLRDTFSVYTQGPGVYTGSKKD